MVIISQKVLYAYIFEFIDVYQCRASISHIESQFIISPGVREI